MIIVSGAILLYVRISKPFRNDFNNYFAEISQVFLFLFYAECLVFSVLADDEYSDFRKLMGICVSIGIFAYMLFLFLAGLVIYYKNCKCKHWKRKLPLS